MEPEKPISIVMIDKNNLDLPVICEMLRNVHIPYQITPFYSYKEAVSYLSDNNTPNPDIIIIDSVTLDLIKDRYIREIKNNFKLKDIPVSILISVEGGKFSFCRLDIPVECRLAKYLQKRPFDSIALKNIDEKYLEFWLAMTDFKNRTN